MPITNGYATLAQLKSFIDAPDNAIWTANDDSNLEFAIEAASRWIDETLNMRFYTATETRYYTAQWYDLVHIDDLVSLSTLKTDSNDDGTYEETWTSSDYYLEPRNAALESEPYRQIRINRNGDYSFPVGVEYGVEVVGTFGYWSTVPAAIVQATLLLATRLWRRKDAIFGVAGNVAAGGVTVVQAAIRADSDILDLINSVNVKMV